MIKWDWFWNWLKRLYSILLISCFILLGNFSKSEFVSSWYYYTSLSDVYSDNWGYTYFVWSDWNFNTSDLDFNSKVFYWPYIDNSVYNHFNIGWIDWNLYFDQYLSSNWITSIQWFIDKWCISSVSSRQSSYGFLHNDCVYNKSLSQVKSSVSWGFSSYAFEVVWSQRPIWFFNSSPLQYCLSDWINDFCFECWVTNCPSWLTWSLDLSLTSFQDISNYSRWYSPFDWHINWWSSEAVIWTLWGDQNYIKCTLNTALQWYNYKWYTERLCYWWLDDFWVFDSAIPIYWNWLTVTDIFSWTKSLRAQWHTWSDFTKSAWFWYWRNLYKWYKHWMYSNNPFYNVPTVLFTYFAAVDVYGGAFDNDSILEYCKIALHDWDLTALYSWVNYDSVCSWSPLSIVNDTVSWYIAVSSSWDWIISWWTTTYTDWKSFISDFFNRLKENYILPAENHNYYLWAIPRYIILAMLWLIVFRFLSH